MRAILTYHSIDSSGSSVSVDPTIFREHVGWLTSGAVRVTSVEELLLLQPGADAVALTFDDGFENFASRAWPLLREHGLPVTLFVVANQAGGTNSWGGKPQPGIPELPLLDWDSLARLAEQGVALGSHGWAHTPLPTATDESLRAELVGSSELIAEHTGVTPRIFAYPFGAVDERSRSAASRAYSWACTTELQALGRQPDPYLLPRLDAYYYRVPRKLENWGSVFFRSRLWLRYRLRTVRGLIRRGP